MSETFEDISETFAFLDEWEDRYRYVIELGKAMPDLEEAFCVPATKVEGCASQVWLLPHIEGTGPDAIFTMRGTSDAMIVRGLMAILVALFSGKTVKEAASINAIDKFAELGLDQHLSSQRSNGLRAMIERVKQVTTAAYQT